jgi:hypothetical protein
MKPNRLVDWLLSNDPALRARLVQVSLGMGAMLAGVASMHYFAAMGLMSVRGLWAWTACAVAAIVLAWALVRSGRTARLPDPTLAVPQMVVALTLGAWLYAMLGPARGAAFPVVMVMLMFGLFAATPRQMAVVGLYAVAVFGATMALMAWRQPQRYPVAVELGHFLVVARRGGPAPRPPPPPPRRARARLGTHRGAGHPRRPDRHREPPPHGLAAGG